MSSDISSWLSSLLPALPVPQLPWNQAVNQVNTDINSASQFITSQEQAFSGLLKSSLNNDLQIISTAPAQQAGAAAGAFTGAIVTTTIMPAAMLLGAVYILRKPIGKVLKAKL